MTDLEAASGATVVVNGVKMSMKDFKKRFKKPEEKPVKDEVDDSKVKELDVVGEGLTGFRSLCRPFNTLSGFLSRSYRSFGKVSDNVIDPCRREWYAYSRRYRELLEIMDKLETTSPRKVRDIRDYSEQLYWKTEELTTAASALWKKYDSKRDWYYITFGGQLIYEGRCRKGTEQMYDYGLKQLILEKPSYVLEKASARLNEKARFIAKIAASQAEYGYYSCK